MLPPGRECNPAHWAVPGPVRDPAHAQDIPKASQMRSKAIPSSQNGPQKAYPRPSNGIQMVSSLQSIESSNRPIIESSSLGAGGRGRSPSDSPHPFRGAGRAEHFLQNLQNLKLRGAPPPAAGPCPKCSKINVFSALEKNTKNRRSKSQKWLQWKVSRVHGSSLWSNLNHICHDFCY